jgi:hypothetical protein
MHRPVTRLPAMRLPVMRLPDPNKTGPERGAIHGLPFLSLQPVCPSH